MIDPTSDTWKHVEKMMREEIEASRTALEAVDITERKADWRRGRLSMARAVLALSIPRNPNG